MFGLLHTGDLYKSQTEHLVVCTQTYLKLCYRDASGILDLVKKNKDCFMSFWTNNRDNVKTAKRNLEEQKRTENIEDQLKEIYQELIIHSRTTKLYASFSLESFINSFATFLTNRKILVNVQDETKEVILHYVSRLYDRMSTLDKWEEVAKQFGQSKLNKSTVLWKRFCDLYTYRDNVVHDKPVFIRRTGDIVKIKRGMIRFVKKEEADPSVFAHYINDAYQACKTHDNMIHKLYMITGVEEESIQNQFYVLPQNYHRKIKNVVHKLSSMEEEIRGGICR